MDNTMLLTLAIEAGDIMLTAGAETHRVEDTMKRILSVADPYFPEAIVLSTCLFASIHPGGRKPLAKVKRNRGRAINLEKITRINALSRDFVSGEITLDEAFLQLQKIRHLPSFSYLFVILSYGIGSAAFCPMFQGTLSDCIGAFLTGAILGTLMQFLNRHNISYFLTSLFGGITLTIFALLFYRMGIGGNYDKIIIGCLMPLVPGVTITNAIRDVMEGDFLCGTSKVLEAIIIAVAIASGVGIVLRIYGML